MGIIQDVVQIIENNPSFDRKQLITEILDKTGCSKSIVYSYIYHAQKKLNKPVKTVETKQVTAKAKKSPDEILEIKKKANSRLKQTEKKVKKPVEIDTSFRDGIELIEQELDSFKAPAFLMKDDIKALV